MTEEKPFEATPRRIARARREGDVARAGELAANCGFAASAFCAGAVTPMIAGLAAAALRRAMRTLAAVHAISVFPCATIAGTAMVAIAAAAAAGTVAHLFAQGGLTLVAPAWKLERLDPVAGLRRIVSRETLAHSLRALCAFCCAVVAMAPVLESSAAGIAGSTTIDETVVRAWSDARRLAFVACAVGFVFSFAEFGAARKAWLQRLRMSFEERKRELKEDEGDASARGRRRQLHRQLLRGGVNRVREAAFVVVNPTHVAVAMAYRPPTVAVPEVLVAAADATALRVRAIASKRGIPIVENPALARALYRDARAGFAIPHAFYVAVADVVAALLRQGVLSA